MTTVARGTRIGSYEIVAVIGAGGMGEVYRARDTKLGRDVALKVLPESFATDLERVARMRREAQVLAALNHPNIAAIYHVEETADGSAIVMELVEGDTLADRISRGPIALDEALPIAKQIAEALEAAHEQGIIHRDLKPANIKVRPDGTVKILDFGLAKLTESNAAGGGVPNAMSMAPTITSPALVSGVGVLLGTAAYMSPEQAKGRPADKRSDIWAFGCVVYEMLTGRRAFDGDDVVDVLGAVARLEPDWNALPSYVPASFRALLQGCLTKDRRRRVADISTALFVLEKGPNLAPQSVAMSTVPISARSSWRRAAAFALGGVAIAAGATTVTWVVTRPVPAAPVRLTVASPESSQLGITGQFSDVAISPDGRRLAYIVGNGTASRLYLRPLDRLEEIPLAPASDADMPFFSPDGNWVGFTTGLNTLMKVAASGGPPVTIARAPGAQLRGASWGPGDEIIFADDSAAGLMRVPSGGGIPTVLTKPDAGTDHYFPEVLPGGRGLLFTITPSLEETDSSADQIAVLDLRSGEHRVIVSSGSNAHYAASGHLVYAVDGTLRAVRFDLDRLTVSGDPVPVVNQVVTKVNGAANFAMSTEGTLAYQEGGSGSPLRRLVWVNRKGHEEPIAAPPRAYVSSLLSPDGTRIALDARDQGNDVWIWSLPRQTLTRLTFDPRLDIGGIWSPDGQHVAFSRSSDGGNLYWQAADGTGVAERLTQRTKGQQPNSFSPDGRFLVFSEPLGIPRDIGMVALTGDRESELLLQSPFDECNAEISPDGRWLAYQSNESGRTEVYVRPFPNVNAGRWQVSTNGGFSPAWARNGRELFYLNGGTPRQLLAVPVRLGATFGFGNPTVLFDRVYRQPGNGRNYDVSPDGQRFVLISDSEQASSRSQLNVILNVGEELKRLVLTK